VGVTTKDGVSVSRRRWLLWAAANGVSLGPPVASARSKVEAGVQTDLVLARQAPADVDPAGYLVSEKYDGVRAWWDGSCLRFRSGAAVAAPDWFTLRLPRGESLDGELWIARGRFEAVSGIVRKARPVDAEWRDVRYMLFEMPHAGGTFADRARALQVRVAHSGFDALRAVPQQTVGDRVALQRRLAEVVGAGGEGLVLHRADAPYIAGRTDALLKLKPLQDAEAVVVGHIAGRGKYAGQLGALRVQTDEGIRFAIGTGLSDAQRADPPPIGTVVTYTYQGVTAGGTPRFARLLRVRADT
jgi:DNA ligase-1